MAKKKSSFKIPLGGRIGRIAKAIRDETNLETAEKVMTDFHVFESAKNYPDKAAWMKEMVSRLENEVPRAKRLTIMRSCGRKCCGVTHRKLARQLMDESKSIKELLKKLNERGIGGGRLKLKDRKTIIGGYDRCYCGPVKGTREPFPTKTYCQCSTGWYQQLFESALGREVKVELLHSIIMGAKTCEFVIHI